MKALAWERNGFLAPKLRQSLDQTYDNFDFFLDRPAEDVKAEVDRNIQRALAVPVQST
jgi:hypothetical protein